MVSNLRATFSVNTPLFLGGADPQGGVPELRPPSVKGLLRFWWRALAWSRFAGNLGQIHKEEAKIFGAAGDGSGHGQASFILRVVPGAQLSTLRPPAILTTVKDKVGARYFGYGLMEAFDSKRTGKKAGQPPFEFTVELISREPPDKTLIDALKLMGLLGGLGSRTRRGWGSLSLLSLEGADETWSAPTDRENYRQALLDAIGKARHCEREPRYSAFWKETRIEIVGSDTNTDTDPLQILNTIGEEMIRYRSWGRNGRILHGKLSEKNFTDDHDWFRERLNFADNHPRRAIFGLPHNYAKNLGVQTQHYDRRASPLLVHVHRLADTSYIAVLVILRSAFLPENERLWVWEGKPERLGGDPERIPAAQLREPKPDWSVLEEFVDRFPESTRVLP
jgi:CRISPR-associated protein Cmr1